MRKSGKIAVDERPTSAEDRPLSELEEKREPWGLIIACWVGIILSPLVCVWVFKSELLYNSADLVSMSLTFAAVGVLLALLLIRLFFRRFSSRNILLIYAIVAGTIGVSTMGMVQFLITTLLAPFYFATPENRWQEFWKAIPDWAAPKAAPGSDIVKGFFLGNSSLYKPEIWRAWVVPVLLWSLFIVFLLAAQYCIAHLMYRRWAREERLTFPVVQIPIILTEATGEGKRLLVIGALVAIIVQGLNALHFMWPSVPGIHVLPVDIGATLPLPWNAMGPLCFSYYPCIIGLSMLVPTNILFSSVFFFWVTRAENIIGHLWGLHAGGGGGIGFPYGAEQAQGAMLSLALMILWTSRKTLRKSFANRDDRIVWFILAVSSLGLLCFGHALGLRLLTNVVFFGIFLLMMLSISWIRAAIGLVWNPGVDIGWWAHSINGASMPLREGVGLAYMRWFSFGDWRAHAAPTYVDMMRLSESARIKRKRLLIGLIFGSILSTFASLWIALDVYYKNGAATALTAGWRTYNGMAGFNTLRSYLDGMVPNPDASRVAATMCGGLIIVALHVASSTFMWWPLHPAGFIAAQTGSLEWMWCPVAIALVLKVFLLRMGGLKLYRRALPFFIGLVIGDFAVGVLLAVLGQLLHMQLYKCFPI